MERRHNTSEANSRAPIQEIPAFIESTDSLPCSQQPVAGSILSQISPLYHNNIFYRLLQQMWLIQCR